MVLRLTLASLLSLPECIAICNVCWFIPLLTYVGPNISKTVADRLGSNGPSTGNGIRMTQIGMSHRPRNNCIVGVANAQLLHKICKYAYKNIHYKPWMTPIEVFKGGGGAGPSWPPTSSAYAMSSMTSCDREMSQLRPGNYVWGPLSQKRLEIQTQLQWDT